jgi:hypothetical protein
MLVYGATLIGAFGAVASSAPPTPLLIFAPGLGRIAHIQMSAGKYLFCNYDQAHDTMSIADTF